MSHSAQMIGIKVIALDVDGVLTDGGFWWGPNGEEWKRFSFADVMGISLATKAGLVIALISGEDSPLVDRYAAKMRIGEVEKNCKNKALAIQRLAERRGFNLSEICFMGDDINDIPAMEIAGLAAAPANAHPEALQRAGFIATRSGGNGAVRELVDSILLAQNEKR